MIDFSEEYYVLYSEKHDLFLQSCFGLNPKFSKKLFDSKRYMTNNNALAVLQMMKNIIYISADIKELINNLTPFKIKVTTSLVKEQI